MNALRNTIVGLLVSLTLPFIGGGISYAADYQEGVDYFRCTDKVLQFEYKECRPLGANTPAFKRVPFTDRTGAKTLEQTVGTMYLHCDQYGCAVDVFGPFSNIPKGTMMGNVTSGDYAIEVGWYLDYDAAGNPTAYLYGRGPDYGEERVGSHTPRKPAGYGTEACYNNKVNQLLSAYPTATISQETIDEWSAECGLN